MHHGHKQMSLGQMDMACCLLYPREWLCPSMPCTPGMISMVFPHKIMQHHNFLAVTGSAASPIICRQPRTLCAFCFRFGRSVETKWLHFYSCCMFIFAMIGLVTVTLRSPTCGTEFETVKIAFAVSIRGIAQKAESPPSNVAWEKAVTQWWTQLLNGDCILISAFGTRTENEIASSALRLPCLCSTKVFLYPLNSVHFPVLFKQSCWHVFARNMRTRGMRHVDEHALMLPVSRSHLHQHLTYT